MPANDLHALSTSLHDLAAQLDGPAAREVLTRVGVDVRKVADEHAGNALGSDQRFSGWRTGKVGAGFEFEGDTRIVVSARPNGPAVVAEDGRKPGGRTARRGGYRGRPVRWGATAGRGWWTRTAADVDARLPDLVADAMTDFLGF
jgi:hypothetical protein